MTVEAGGKAAPFSLTGGGPFYRLLRRIGVEPDRGRGLWRLVVLSLAVTWLPLAIMAAVGQILEASVPVLFADFAVHARLLLGIPLLLLAERSLHRRTQRCMERFQSENWAPGSSKAIERITAQAAHVRDATAPELVLLLLSLVGSQVVVGGMFEGLGISRGRDIDREALPLTVWYVLVSLPLFQFLVYRWIWRWLIWWWVLIRLSRLPLEPLPTHPDLRGGLGFLSEPSVGFAHVLAAVSAVQSGIWADRIVWNNADLTSFKQQAALLVVLAGLVVFLPLATFMYPLWRARFRALRQYDGLAAQLAGAFHQHWIVGGPRQGLLGTPDVSSLADLGTAYDVIRRMRMTPFGVREVFVVVSAVVMPLVPLVLLKIPLFELVRKLGDVMMGGLPG